MQGGKSHREYWFFPYRYHLQNSLFWNRIQIAESQNFYS